MAWLKRYGASESDLDFRRARDEDPSFSLGLLAIASGSLPRHSLGDAAFESLFVAADQVHAETAGWIGRLESRLREDERVFWSLSSLAADLGVHPVYLARVFRHRYGTSLTAYLHRARLLSAARRLEGGLCLTTIALESGFSDHAHLSRSFKAWFGSSPSQIRNRLREVSIVQAFGDAIPAS